MALLLGGCAVNPVSRETDFVLLSEAGELALGQRYHQQVLARYLRYRDPALSAYVNRVGQAVAVLSQRSGLDYHFTILDSAEVNAFALPGGFIYLTRGILAYLDSEAELAAVLGHEIGHVAARHAVRLDARQRTGGFFGRLLFDHIGFGVDVAYDRFTTRLQRGYSREFELEADRLAVEYLARAGYRADAMDQIITLLRARETLAQADGHAEAEHAAPIYHGLSTHPDNARRQQVVEDVMAALAAELPPPRPADPDRFRQRLRGLVFGPSAEQGRVIEDHYLHGPSDTALRVPAGWSVNSQHQVVALVAPDRQALIQVLKERRVAGTAPRTLLEGLPLEAPMSDEQALLAPGPGRGWLASSVGATPFGHGPVRLASWLNGEQAWLLVASERNPGRHVAVMEQSLRSLRPLRPAERERIRPRRLDLVRAAAGTTYAELAAASPLGEDAEARLRLLNGQTDPAEQPRPGRWLKVVR